MHDNTSPLFSVHEYDCDGDELERGIFLHFGDTRIKVGESVEELRALSKHIEKISKEIEENYLI